MGFVDIQNIRAQNQSTINFFGKNRIQYNEKKQEWSFLRAENYDVYFTQGGRELAVYTIRMAQGVIQEVEEYLNYRGPSKYQIIIYNTLGDAMQTNLGFDLEQYNTGGFTKIIGAKVVLAFDGSRANFERQLKVGIAQVLINDMLYGGNIQERLQNSALIYLPTWYIDGFLKYFEKGWSVVEDGELLSCFQGKNAIKRFSQLLESNEILAGQSFWHYIVETYGKTSVTNILYLTRVNRDVESALQYVLGKSLKSISVDWYNYFSSVYAKQPESSTNVTFLKLKGAKKSTYISKAALSPDAKKLAYVGHRNGVNTIYVTDLEQGKTYKVHQSGLKHLLLANVNQYPVITWHPQSKHIAYFYENKSRVYFGTIDIKEQPERKVLQFSKNEFQLLRFDQVMQASYSPDGQHIAVAAARVGQSDIYLYHVPSKRVVPITQDHFDDADPVFIENGGRLLFSSNRSIDTLINNLPDTIPMQNNFDLFAYNFTRNSKNLLRITNTPFANEGNPTAVSQNFISFLSSASGIVARWYGQLDSTERIHFETDSLGNIDTIRHVTDVAEIAFDVNFSNNLLAQHKAEKRPDWVAVPQIQAKRPQLLQGKFSINNSLRLIDSVPKSSFQSNLEQKNAVFVENTMRQQIAFRFLFPKKADTLVVESEKTDSSLLANYIFQVDANIPFLDEQIDRVFASERNASIARDPFRQSRTRIYNTNFRLDYLITQVSNNNFQGFFPNFIISSANTLNQRIGFVFQGGTSDLFENYRFTGGALISSDFNHNQYFMVYESLKKRIDKRLIFNQFRSVDPISLSPVFPGFVRTNSVEIMGSLIYPFNPFTSVRLHGIYKRDRIDTLATDILPLASETGTRNWAGVRAEYIFDNSVNPALNIYYGTRLKAFVEMYKNLSQSQTFLGVLGIDYRTYTKIHKTFIWANRFAANYSFGQNRILYYLGGVDNWLLPRRDGLPAPADYSFAYEALGTNMRGFVQNARNGSNFFVVNSELRLPLLPVLSRNPIASDFLRNFQLVGFVDVGTAWTGINPFSLDNPFNVSVFQNGPVKVTVFTNRNPILVGYGTGIRMRLFGYFVRGDVAWGVDDGVRSSKPRYYLSLALDF